MHRTQSKTSEKWNSFTSAMANKTCVGDATTSKKYERPVKEKMKSFAKPIGNQIFDPSPKTSQHSSSVRTKSIRSKKHPFSSSLSPTSQSTVATLKLLQDQINILSQVNDEINTQQDIVARRTASLDDSFERIREKAKSGNETVYSSQSTINSNLERSLEQLQTSYKEAKRMKRKFDKPSLPLQTNEIYSSELCLQAEKEVCTTKIGNYVDVLNLKPQTSNKETVTKEIQHVMESTQTEFAWKNICSVPNSTNMTTQTELVNEESDTHDELDMLAQIAHDSEALLCTLKMYDYQQRLCSTMSGPELKSNCITKSHLVNSNSTNIEFMNILENYLHFPTNLLSESLLKIGEEPEEVSISKYEDCNDKVSSIVLCSKGVNTSEIWPETPNLLEQSIESSNLLIKQLDSVSTKFQKAFEKLNDYQKDSSAEDMTTSDYQTIANYSEQTTPQLNYALVPNKEVNKIVKSTSCDESFNIANKVNIAIETLNDSIICNDNASLNQIRLSISNASYELMNVLEQMKNLETFPRTIQKNVILSQKTINENMDTTKNIENVNWDLYKSQKSMMNESNDELTSNFSTCTEITEDFGSFDKPDKQSKTCDKISTTQKVECKTVKKVLSTISTNTEELDSVPKKLKSLSKCKRKRFSIKQPRKKIQLKIPKVVYDHSNHCKQPILNFSMSDYYAIFSTKSKLKSSSTQCQNKQLVIVSQTPSIGDFRYVYKEYDTDSAVIVNSSTSCGEYNGHPLSIKSSHMGLMRNHTNCNIIEEKRRGNQDTSDWTYAEELPIMEIEDSNKLKLGEHISTQSTQPILADIGIQMNVPCVDACGSMDDVELSHAAVQKTIQQTDKDISTTEVFDLTNEPVVFDGYPLEETSITDQVYKTPLESNVSELQLDIVEKQPQLKMDQVEICDVPDTPRQVDQVTTTQLSSNDIVVDYIRSLKETKPNELLETVIHKLQDTIKQEDVQINNWRNHASVKSEVGLNITSVRCIGASSILIKWECGTNPQLIIGYHIYVNNILKSIIHSAVRTTAVIDEVKPKSTLFIRVCSITDNAIINQLAEATFKML